MRFMMWLDLWRSGVIGMAIAAPTLAIARITRAVNRGAAETEFARWFHHVESPQAGRSASRDRADF